MRAIRVHRFGGLDSLVEEHVPRPAPGDGEVPLRAKAAGVGPWDAWIGSGQSVLPQPLPLTLGSDVSGIVEHVGPGVSQLAAGDAVFGWRLDIDIANGDFCGVQMTPYHSQASIIFGKGITSARPGFDARPGARRRRHRRRPR